MKIRPGDLAILRAKIQPLDTKDTRELYRQKGLSDKRYRWDLLYRSKLRIGDGVGTQGDVNLYGYLTDAHIDTALKSFIQPLN